MTGIGHLIINRHAQRHCLVAKLALARFQPGLTVRKAVSLAGGFKERASKEKIFVIREEDKTQTPVKVDQSALVHPGDIITVEESFF